jgi:hypothetical protein
MNFISRHFGKVFLGWLLWLSCLGCGSSAVKSVSSAPKTSKSAQSKIVFASFLISKQLGKNSKIELLSVTESNGKLKKNTEANVPSNDYLTLEITSEQSSKQIFKIEHPLYKTVEYVNDQHQLTSQYVETDQADFFIRFEKTGPVQIKVSETRNKQKIELKTFKI